MKNSNHKIIVKTEKLIRLMKRVGLTNKYNIKWHKYDKFTDFSFNNNGRSYIFTLENSGRIFFPISMSTDGYEDPTKIADFAMLIGN